MELHCADCVDPQCDYVAEGADEDSLIKAMLDHVRGHHAHIIDGKAVEEQRAQVRSWVQTFAR